MSLELPLRKIMNQVSRPHFRAALADFKKSHCDENRLIAAALKEQLRPHLVPPLLDVGAGLGDIAETAFPDLPAILLDVNEIPPGPSSLHRRVVGNFFDYEPDQYGYPGTLLLCHVLQYLDDDLRRLRSKVSALGPQVIIEVSNDNTGAFGDIMFWSLTNIAGANPEMRCDFVDREKYNLVGTVPILATLRCPTLSIMAHHFVEVLIDAPPTKPSLSKMEEKLKTLVSESRIGIEQTIYCYEQKR